MGLFDRRQPLRPAVTASAARLTRKRDEASKRLLGADWQTAALRHYDQIGELHFAGQFLARMMSRVRLYPARLQSDGELTEITSGAPVEVFNQIRDPGGGRTAIQYDYGRLMMITGEGVLFGSRLETDEERWRFLWKGEVKVRDDGSAIRLDSTGKETDETGTAYRFWFPHPKHSDLADSPMRAIYNIAEELLLLEAGVMASASARTTNGVLVYSQAFSPAPADPGLDEDPEQSILITDMTEHFRMQKENPGAAESRAPFGWEVPLAPGERVQDLIMHLRLHDPANDYLERELRTETIKRMALAMDMPPEALLGMTDANHWTAKQVMHDMWRSHGINRAERFADDLADAYLKPTLRNAGEEWENIVIGVDDGQVVISPDRTEDALKAHKDGLLSGDSTLRALGWNPDKDKMEGEEKDEWLALQLRAPELLGEDDMRQPARGPLPSTNGRDPTEGPPEPTGAQVVSRQEGRTAAIMGAASLALRQCRSRAGNRLRSHQHACEECKEKARGAPNAIVAAILGLEQVQEFGLHPAVLVKGGCDDFQGILCEWGIEETAARMLCKRVEDYAAHTLFHHDQPELPPGFIAQVAQAMEVSDAVSH